MSRRGEAVADAEDNEGRKEMVENDEAILITAFGAQPEQLQPDTPLKNPNCCSPRPARQEQAGTFQGMGGSQAREPE